MRLRRESLPSCLPLDQFGVKVVMYIVRDLFNLN